MFTSIVVPLDGSAFAEHALPYAAVLARPGGAVMEILHVHHPFLPGAALEALPQYRFQGITDFDDAEDAAAFEREVERFHALAAGLAEEHGLRATARVLHGPVADSLTDYAHGSGADLIVLASHGHGGIRHTWLGSVPDFVVRHSAIPVLVVRPEEGPPPAEAPIRRMLVAVDGSPFSEAILRPAQALARATGAEISLVRVAPNGSAATALPSFLRTRQPDPHAYLEELAAGFPPELDPPTRRVVAGRQPAVAILEEAESEGYDLVAMATHGHGGPRYMLLGSTADKVLRASRRPVLLFRPPHAAVHSRAAAPAALAHA